MAKATKLRQRVSFAMEARGSLGDVLYRVDKSLQKVICFFCGHIPERDQCGNPEHDYCPWCLKSMPHSWSTKQT